MPIILSAWRNSFRTGISMNYPVNITLTYRAIFLIVQRQAIFYQTSRSIYTKQIRHNYIWDNYIYLEKRRSKDRG
jgi:hypothetical protein